MISLPSLLLNIGMPILKNVTGNNRLQFYPESYANRKAWLGTPFNAYFWHDDGKDLYPDFSAPGSVSFRPSW